MLLPVIFKKGNSSLLKKPHCIFSKSLPPSNRYTSGPNSLFLPSYTASDIVYTWKAIDAGVTPQDTKDQENIGRHGNAMPPHGTLTPSSKAVISLASSLSLHLFLHGYGNVTMERAFK